MCIRDSSDAEHRRRADVQCRLRLSRVRCAFLRHRQGAGVKGTRLRLTVPTRPARDAVLAFLTGLEASYDGPFAGALTELRDAAENNVAIAFEDGGLLQSLDAVLEGDGDI